METGVSIKTSEFSAAVIPKLEGMKAGKASKIAKANGAVIYEVQIMNDDL